MANANIALNVGSMACHVLMGVTLLFFARAVRNVLRSGEAREATYFGSGVRVNDKLMTKRQVDDKLVDEQQQRERREKKKEPNNASNKKTANSVGNRSCCHRRCGPG